MLPKDFTFSQPYTVQSRNTIKSQQFNAFCKEVQQTFRITATELQWLLPQSSKLFENKLSNGVISYSLGKLPPFFIRRPAPFVAETKPTPNKNQDPKTKKKEDPETFLIPTIFALWRLPQLLPSTMIPRQVFSRVTGVKPTKLYFSGIICPDLPDQFLLHGALHPSQFIRFFPNHLFSTLVDQEENQDELEFPPHTPGYALSPTTITTPCPSIGFPAFFHRKSFDFVYNPFQLRAIYIENNPYCIGIGMVGPEVKSAALFLTAQTPEAAKGSGYISPWSNDNFIDRQDIPHKLASIKRLQHQNALDAYVKATTWPQHNAPVDTPTQQDDNDDNDDDNKNTETISFPIDIHQKTTKLGQVLSLLRTAASQGGNTNKHTSLFYDLLCRSENLKQIFPLSADYLEDLEVPSPGFAANHSHAADLSLLTDGNIHDSRPMPNNQSIHIMQCMDDTLCLEFKQFYPSNGFVWESAEHSAPLSAKDFIMVTNCVLLLLRAAWLVSCCKPTIKRRISSNNNDNDDQKQSKTESNNDDASQQQHASQQASQQQQQQQQQPSNNETVVSETTNEPQLSTVSPTTNDTSPQDNNQLTETGDDEGGDDEEPAVIDPANLPAHDDSSDMICQTCFAARLEWALQFAVKERVDQYPLHLSDLMQYIRQAQDCPSCLRHVHSTQFDKSQSETNSKHKKKATGKQTVYCTCSSCIAAQQTDNNDHATLVTTCLCAKKTVPLTCSGTFCVKYAKISQLAKIASKAGWIVYNALNKSQIITACGTVSIKITAQDKKRADEHIEKQQAQFEENKLNALKDDDNSLLSVVSIVRTINAVKITPALHQFMQKNNPSLVKLLSWTEKRLLAHAGQLDHTPFEMLDIICCYVRFLWNNQIIFPHYIDSTIRNYIQQKQLVLVWKQGKILKQPACEPDCYPPAVKQAMNAASMPEREESEPSDDDDDEIVNERQQQHSDSDFDDYQPGASRQYQMNNALPSDDDEDLLAAGGNVKGLSRQEIKTTSYKANKRKRDAETRAKNTNMPQKDAPTKKQNQAKNNNNNNNKSTANNSQQQIIYVCYDAALFKALNLSREKTYTMRDIDQLLETKSFVQAVTSACNPELSELDQVARQPEFIEYLYSISGLPADAELPPIASKTVTDCVKICQNQFKNTNGPDLIQRLLHTLKFRADSTSSIVPATTTSSAANSSAKGGKKKGSGPVATIPAPKADSKVPRILLFSKKVKNHLITWASGFELFGISPKSLAQQSEFSKIMAGAVSVVIVQDQPQIKQLWPVPVSVHCPMMLQLQGNKMSELAEFAVKHLNIDANAIFIALPGGRLQPAL